MGNEELDLYYDNLIEYEVATKGEIGMAVHFKGYTIEALNEVLFYKTGYRNWEQFAEECIFEPEDI